MIDAGPRGTAPSFFRSLGRYGIAPGQIRLIIITHVHFDHVGSLHAIQQQCNCPVLVHQTEAELLSRGRVVLPPGTHRLTHQLVRLANRHPRLVKQLFRFEPVTPDRVITGPLNLTPLGFDAHVFPTPGHTPGSLTMITASGQAFVGDLAVNYLLGGRGPYWPPFGDSRRLIRDSWQTLRNHGATNIYPAHGRPFRIEKLPA
jgi:glyoxylase-like metal-dependent hydrolase (beta-lactamase superfamily II)